MRVRLWEARLLHRCGVVVICKRLWHCLSWIRRSPGIILLHGGASPLVGVLLLLLVRWRVEWTSSYIVGCCRRVGEVWNRRRRLVQRLAYNAVVGRTEITTAVGATNGPAGARLPHARTPSTRHDLQFSKSPSQFVEQARGLVLVALVPTTLSD